MPHVKHYQKTIIEWWHGVDFVYLIVSIRDNIDVIVKLFLVHRKSKNKDHTRNSIKKNQQLRLTNSYATIARAWQTTTIPIIFCCTFENKNILIIELYARILEGLQSNGVEKLKLKPAMKDLVKLIKSTSNLPSDLHITPARIVDATEMCNNSHSCKSFIKLLRPRRF